MPEGTRKVLPSLDDSHLTHFGGMWLMQRFCQRLQLRRKLQRYVPVKQRIGNYRPEEMFLSLLFAIIMGLHRINKTEILQYNGAFLEMLGLARFPDQTALRRFLRRLSPTDIRQLAWPHDSLRDWLFELPEPRHSLIFDVHSVVIVVYGHAQGAAVGCNPKKAGRRSYHPLFCFESHWHEFRQAPCGLAMQELRRAPWGFCRCVWPRYPAPWHGNASVFARILGFLQRVVEFLDGSGCGYVMDAKEYSTIKAAAQCTRFTALHDGWEYGEFGYQPQKWKEPHRFVVVRRPIPEDPQEAKQLTLFKDRRYAYHVFATNLELDAWRVYLFYNGRANIEMNNREFLYDYALGKIPTQSWTANVAFFQLLLFAADLVHWFKRLCLPASYRAATLETIRTGFLVLPAKLLRVSKKNIVKLPADYHYRKELLQAERAFLRLRLPDRFRFWPRQQNPWVRMAAAHMQNPRQELLERITNGR